MTRTSNVDGAKLITLIEVRSIIGSGVTDDDPVRPLVEYFNLDG